MWGVMTISRNFFVLDDFNLRGKRVLLRLDINSPMDPVSGEILDDSRMRAHIETLDDLSKSKVIILAHQSKPGKKDFTNLRNHANRLSKIIKRPVKYVDSLFDSRAIQAIEQMVDGVLIHHQVTWNKRWQVTPDYNQLSLKKVIM